MKISGLPEFTQVKYIKLGVGGSWATSCFDRGIIRLGFDTGIEKVYSAAIRGDWEKIKNYWADGRCKTPQQHANQTRTFFEDSGNTLWVTFHNRMLYYCIANPGHPVAESNPISSDEHDSSYRTVFKQGWSNVDVNGHPLMMDNLSGNLTKTAGYRMTICGFSSDIENYIVQKISAIPSLNAENAISARNALVLQIENIIKSFTWEDFEILVELIFGNSGWKRISKTGGVQKTIDLVLKDPVTSEIAFVQVKSKTNQSILNEYIDEFKAGNYDRMFFAYHSGNAEASIKGVHVWNSKWIAEKVLDSGLIDWVIDRAK
jgi:hypothetical protein